MTTTTAKPTLAELEAILADKAKVTNLVGEGKLGEFLRDYADARMEQQSDTLAAVRDQAEKTLAEWLKDNGAAIGRLNLTQGDLDGDGGIARQRSKLYNKAAPGAQLDKDYVGSGDFFQTIWHHANTLPDSDRMFANQAKWKKIQNSFGSQIPADGGFLIPETLRSELLSVALETSIVRSRARVIPMSSLRLPIPSVDSTSNVSSVFGGIVCYWTEEGATLTESQASFGRVVLEAKKLTAYSEAPNELIADAPGFGSFLDQILPEALAFYEDDAFINGTGVGEPLGVLNGSAAISVTKATGQAADTIVWENIVSMYSRMLPTSLSRAVWIASIDTFPQLATMALEVGTAGSAIWLSSGVDQPPVSILGRPVIFTEKAPVVGDAGDLTFVDFGYYLIGDRQVMQASSSPHYKFASDKTAFRVIERVDGRPWLESAITPKNNGATLSPIVKIAARA